MAGARTPRLPSQIETERLLLVPPRLADAPALCDAVQASYKELHEWMAWAKAPYGLTEAQAFCADAERKLRDSVEFAVLMTRKDSGQIVGSSGLVNIDWDVPSCEIGYWVRTDCTGQGYATEAAHALAHYALATLRAARVEIRMDARNERSWRVAKRLGFQWEATLRAHGRDNHGALRDTRVYAMFALSELAGRPSGTLGAPYAREPAGRHETTTRTA